MPRLRPLGGKDLVRAFSALGFKVVSQRGSHAKLRRVLDNGTKQTLTIPIHDELDRGTLHAVFRQALRYVPEEQLRKYFYAD
jgi:predicted RNA binding protein YcfA (HicA-like mRNA interferase family)